MPLSDEVVFGALAVSVISSVVAIMALLRTDRFDRMHLNLQSQVIDLQHRQFALEEARDGEAKDQLPQAKLVASLEIRPGLSKYHYCFVVANQGLATTRKVQTRINQRPLPSVVATGQKEIQEIAGGASVDYLISAPTGKAALPYAVVITWEDASGRQGMHKATLTSFKPSQ